MSRLPKPLLTGQPVTLVERLWPGLSFGKYRENIQDGVEWPVSDERHTIIIHMDGRMDSMESELEGGGWINGRAMRGEVWSVPAGRRYVTAARGRTVTYGVLKVDESAMRDALGSRLGPVDLQGCLGRHDPILFRLAEGLGQMCGTTGDIARLGADHLAYGMGAHILTRYRQDADRAPRQIRRHNELPPKAALRLRDFIEDNLAEPLTLDGMSAVAGMTEHQLLEGFRLHFGTTPAQYVLDRRMRRARAMLADTVMSVTQIALCCGFSSSSHFATSFRKRVGCTPSQYRDG
ncbi:MAG: AraC family transcriptional regulator [Litorimonas sp.]